MTRQHEPMSTEDAIRYLESIPIDPGSDTAIALRMAIAALRGPLDLKAMSATDLVVLVERIELELTARDVCMHGTSLGARCIQCVAAEAAEEQPNENS